MGDHRGLARRPRSPPTARDAVAGRPTELDAITGSVVRAGRRLGVPTPALDGLLAEARAERSRRMTTAPARDLPRRRPLDARPSAATEAAERPVRLVVGAAARPRTRSSSATLALLRYESFASDFDHGIFSQYVWLLGHLHEPFNTINLRTLLGDHVEPGIAVLAPLGTLGRRRARAARRADARARGDGAAPLPARP